MRLASLAYRLSSDRLSNADVIDHVCALQPVADPDALALLRRRIETGFALSGSEYRYIWLDEVDAMEILADAVAEALDAAALRARDLDLILYAGVARGCLEPAMSALVHNRIGATRALSFDVIDACTSWMRGLQVADAMISASGIRNVLLVNCELGMRGFGALSEMTAENLDLYFSTLTVGEAVTACVLQPGGQTPEFHGSTFSEGFGQCMLPLDNAATFVGRDLPGDAAPNRFFAKSTPLVQVALDGIAEVWGRSGFADRPAPDLTLIHSVSTLSSRRALKRLGLSWDRHFDIHASHGNTVSASLPLGIALAREAGRLGPGTDLLMIGAGAGVSVGLCRLRWES